MGLLEKSRTGQLPKRPGGNQCCGILLPVRRCSAPPHRLGVSLFRTVRRPGAARVPSPSGRQRRSASPSGSSDARHQGPAAEAEQPRGRLPEGPRQPAPHAQDQAPRRQGDLDHPRSHQRLSRPQRSPAPDPHNSRPPDAREERRRVLPCARTRLPAPFFKIPSRHLLGAFFGGRSRDACTLYIPLTAKAGISFPFWRFEVDRGTAPPRGIAKRRSSK